MLPIKTNPIISQRAGRSAVHTMLLRPVSPREAVELSGWLFPPKELHDANGTRIGDLCVSVHGPKDGEITCPAGTLPASRFYYHKALERMPWKYLKCLYPATLQYPVSKYHPCSDPAAHPWQPLGPKWS